MSWQSSQQIEKGSGFSAATNPLGRKTRPFRRISIEQAGRKAFVMVIIILGIQREIAVAQ
jgi:hypothetical protein